MINPSTIAAGDVLFDVHNYKDGRGRSKRGCWRVTVLRIVAPTSGGSHPGFECSWNGNPSRLYSWSQVAKLRRSPPKDQIR